MTNVDRISNTSSKIEGKKIVISSHILSFNLNLFSEGYKYV